MDPNKTHSILHNKGNNKKKWGKNFVVGWEKIFANNMTNKRLITKSYNRFIQLHETNKQTKKSI